MQVTTRVSIKSTKSLDNVDSQCNDGCVAGYFQTLEALRTQFSVDTRELRKLREEQASLREAYLRFNDLEQQIQNKIRRLESTGALLADTLERPKVEKQLTEAGLTLDPKWREEMALWRVIREIVRQYKKIQVSEVCKILYELDFNVSRQGVESALRTHANRFRITRRGREKYLSIK